MVLSSFPPTPLVSVLRMDTVYLVEEYKGGKEYDWSSSSGGVGEGKHFMVLFSESSEQALVENAKRFVASLHELENGMDLYTFAANMSARWTHHRVRTSFYAFRGVEGTNGNIYQELGRGQGRQ